MQEILSVFLLSLTRKEKEKLSRRLNELSKTPRYLSEVVATLSEGGPLTL